MSRTPKPQVTSVSGMDKPALHPDRIRAALAAIEMESKEDEKVFDAVHVETFKAALQLIRKSQLAVGLTGQVVDAGRSAMDLLEALKRIGSR